MSEGQDHRCTHCNWWLTRTTDVQAGKITLRCTNRGCRKVQTIIIAPPRRPQPTPR
jgi:hypothetical protein